MLIIHANRKGVRRAALACLAVEQDHRHAGRTQAFLVQSAHARDEVMITASTRFEAQHLHRSNLPLRLIMRCGQDH